MKNIIKMVLVIVALTMINGLLLIASFCLPTGEMKRNVSRSASLFDFEGIYPQWDTGYKATQQDRWSECVLYSMAIREGDESPVEKAMFMKYIVSPDLPQNLALTNYANDVSVYEYISDTYTRYWNGGVLLIKLLLLFFDVSDIRMIFMIIEGILLCLLLYLLVRRNVSEFIIPLFVGIIIIDPITMAMSVKFEMEFIPMLVAMVIIAAFYEKIESFNGGWILFFGVLGSITSFFCMLSFPCITLGLPLILYVYMKNNSNSLYDSIIYTFCWGLAYAITWALKWFFGTLFTDHNFWADAFGQATQYEKETAIEISAFYRLMKNAMVIGKWPYLLLFILAVLIIMALFLARIKHSEKIYLNLNFNRMLAYVVIALTPVLFIILLGNGYAYIHYWMAYRQLAICFSAFYAFLLDTLMQRNPLFKDN